MEKKFSIVIPTLNEELDLPILLSCLKNQTFKNFEVIHVDAKSEDNTILVAKSFSIFFNIKTKTVNKRNVCYQRNKGSKIARGEWLIFMDADVTFDNYFLEEINNKISNEKLDIFVTFYDPDINKVKYKLLTIFSNLLAFITQKSKFPFVVEAMLGVKKSVYENLNGFDENIKVNEGINFVMLSMKQKFIYKVFRKPKYKNSMRRAEKFGLIKMLFKNVIIATMIVSGKRMTKKNVGDLYKMDGGSVYKK
jgi:glycosyltransferase involved in cell wall biosynthesis